MAKPAALASAENGKLGGRPMTQATKASASMREKLVLEVQKNFLKLVEPQMKKAIKGDYTAFRDLLDRAGVKPLEENKINLQINIANILDRHENKGV